MLTISNIIYNLLISEGFEDDEEITMERVEKICDSLLTRISIKELVKLPEDAFIECIHKLIEETVDTTELVAAEETSASLDPFRLYFVVTTILVSYLVLLQEESI